MGIFSSIKDAIFGHPAAAPSPAPQAQASGSLATPPPVDAGQPAAAAQPIDVEAVLGQISSDKGNPDLNWRSSIVDLLKLLGIDSSLSSREQLATELGYAGDKNGSAEMNIWLHKAVMKGLADNGGRVPANMLS